MTCYHPITMYWTGKLTANGKKEYTFNPTKGYKDLPQEIPCGRCIGCRLKRSRDWSIRCMAEAKMHDQNCFVTLTYRPECLPKNGSLDVSAVQKFFKRLRKKLGDKKIRYYMCGEYGSLRSRPHYHICLFGYDFPDKKLYKTNNGYPLYNSKMLETLWPYGYAVVGSLTYESAAYTARYILKKQLGKTAGIYESLGIIPEYTCMSRRPGIGATYFDKYHRDIIANECKVLYKKNLVQMPKYFEKMFELYYENVYNDYRRHKKILARLNEITADDRKRLEDCRLIKIKRLIRPIEGDVLI